MKLDTGRIKEFLLDIRADRQKLIPAIVLSALILIFLVLSVQERAAARRLESAKADNVNFISLNTDYVSLKSTVDELERRAALSPKQGVMKAVDDLFTSMGLKDKLTSVKPLDTRQLDDAISEQAEITVKGADLNEAVNILYRIENAPMLLTIKHADIRSSFTGPALDMRLVLALTRKK
ncbi:MAG: hypothetical protein M0Z59_02340 [Nitrospiraceae bacterium]|nr:hypothetical protein [Nitrospiraceae bacterium]